MQQTCGHEAERLDQPLRPRPHEELHDEHRDVEKDERPVDDRLPMHRERVADGNHADVMSYLGFTTESQRSTESTEFLISFNL